jgi:outer membrane murein-binding lipoprotein Lpp
MTDKELDVIRKRQEERLLSRAAYAPVKREYLSIFAVDAELARAASDVDALLAEVERLRLSCSVGESEVRDIREDATRALRGLERRLAQLEDDLKARRA